MISGLQIYLNACTKARIISQREQRAFHRGEIDWLPCSGDTKRAEIIKAFDRLAALSKLSQQQGLIQAIADSGTYSEGKAKS